GISGVIFVVVLSSFLYFCYLFKVTSKFFVKSSFYDIIVHSKLLFSFGIHTVIANSINLINFEADTIMIGYFLTKSDVGFYSIAVFFSKLLWLVPDSIQKITYPMISDYYGQNKEEDIKKIVLKTMSYTACISLIIGIPMLIYGKLLITFIYGDSFIQSVSPYYILIIGTIIFSIIKSINSLFASIGKVTLFAKIPTYSAIINILINAILIPLYGTIGAAIATSTSLLVYVFVMLYYMKKFIGINLEILWYFKAILIFISSFLFNEVLLMFVPIYISGVVIELFVLYFIWKVLLDEKERLSLSKIFSR
ncbi:polysaccharide biosynthesis C-terminal domain-containing protein, partial [Methanomethylovorans sp.]|uniref:oligosaccharide flippase family protein n=1 Tax=Methanomethylovorans sp. TaxID=2758717 RepID=UPI003D122EE6